MVMMMVVWRGSDGAGERDGRIAEARVNTLLSMYAHDICRGAVGGCGGSFVFAGCQGDPAHVCGRGRRWLLWRGSRMVSAVALVGLGVQSAGRWRERMSGCMSRTVDVPSTRARNDYEETSEDVQGREREGKRLMILNDEGSQKTSPASPANPALQSSHNGARLMVYTWPSRITRQRHMGEERGTRPCS